MSFSLPEHSHPLCFPIAVLLEDDFSVDEFVSSSKKRVSIETLRNDLDSYFKTLKSAMVELINHDYADFVKLSSNLIGVDKAIEELITPLGQLKEEVMSLKLSLDTAIGSMETRLAYRAELRDKKSLLNNLLSITESVAMLETLLQLHQTPSSLDGSESMSGQFTGIIQDRVASEFSRLQYLMTLSNQHPMIKSLEPRIRSIDQVLESKLRKMFISHISASPDKLAQCLKTYAAIGKQQAAEELFCSQVVTPYMDGILTTRNFNSKSQDLTLLYAEVLNFIPAHCQSLLQAVSRTSSHTHPNQQGFDFLVNAVFPEVVRGIETRLSTIFASGNPEMFYKNYKKTIDFISQFESLCVEDSVQRLRSHSSYISFLNKWSFPVYYQIRFQEIAGHVEGILSGSCEPATQGPPHFKLEPFAATWRSVCRCWEDGVYITPLVHRFWKLTIQLLTRLAVWLEGDSDMVFSVSQAVGAISDCYLISELVNDLYSNSIEDKIPHCVTGKDQFFNGLMEATQKLLLLIPNLKGTVIQIVSKQCYSNLEPTHTIPRLYRRTNKEVPNKPSAYVGAVLKPLQLVVTGKVSLQCDLRDDICRDTLSTVSEKYLSIISDVLMSVKRTEDSLKKLKQRGRKSQDAPGIGGGDMSDDDKIRLQLSIDAEAFVNEVEQLPMVDKSVTQSTALQQLLQLAANAKELALSSTDSSTRS